MSGELSESNNSQTSHSPNAETYDGHTKPSHIDDTSYASTAPAINNLNPSDLLLDKGSGTDSIDVASRKAFGSVSLFLQAELEASGSEIGLLEKLNDASIAKYEELSCQAQDMLVHAYKIKQTYNEMEAHIAEVDSLVVSIDSLEQVAQELDRYSQQIETKFQNLLK